ncbi:uncharacterized protein V1510DRAFT_97872 [Dipodascopsis tothii]|uniref:uncharacterized protein n=1 Tax=Dipodascopsis tothii TaxID=44089 RepID=UPI0034CDC785
MHMFEAAFQMFNDLDRFLPSPKSLRYISEATPSSFDPLKLKIKQHKSHFQDKFGIDTFRLFTISNTRPRTETDTQRFAELVDSFQKERDFLCRYDIVRQWFHIACSHPGIANELYCSMDGIPSLLQYEFVILEDTRKYLLQPFIKAIEESDHKLALDILKSFFFSRFWKYFEFAAADLAACEARNEVDFRNRLARPVTGSRAGTIRLVLSKVFYSLNMCIHPYAPFISESANHGLLRQATDYPSIDQLPALLMTRNVWDSKTSERDINMLHEIIARLLMFSERSTPFDCEGVIWLSGGGLTLYDILSAHKHIIIRCAKLKTLTCYSEVSSD